MGWTDVPWYTICTERFSADFGVDEWFGLSIFLRDGDDVHRTYFLQHGPIVQKIGSIWSMFSLTPYGGQCDDEDAPEGGRRRRTRPGTAVTTSPTTPSAISDADQIDRRWLRKELHPYPPAPGRAENGCGNSSRSPADRVAIPTGSREPPLSA